MLFMVEYGLYYFFLAINQVLQILWHLEILHGSQWENPKICNILKMADRIIQSTFHVRFLEFILGYFQTPAATIEFQPRFTESMVIRENTGCYFWAICQFKTIYTI